MRGGERVREGAGAIRWLPRCEVEGVREIAAQSHDLDARDREACARLAFGWRLREFEKVAGVVGGPSDGARGAVRVQQHGSISVTCDASWLFTTWAPSVSATARGARVLARRTERDRMSCAIRAMKLTTRPMRLRSRKCVSVTTFSRNGTCRKSCSERVSADTKV